MLSPIALLVTIAAAIALVDRNDIESNVSAFQGHSQGLKTEAHSSAESYSGNKNGSIVRKVRNVIPFPQLRWPGAKVPYVLDSSVVAYRALILKAMDNFHKKTCIRFVPRKSEANYIKIFAGRGCYSNVGMIGGQQPVSLGQGCMFLGTVVHELGHAIGLFNEHNRSDRDEYINIKWNNIQTGMASQFSVLKPHENLIIVPFDYRSIMLQGSTFLSKNGRDATITAKNGSKLIDSFDKPGLSDIDVLAIQKMYCRNAN